jgi:hypothetical protein
MLLARSVALVALCFAGCFAPDYGNGTLQCAAGGVCPPGLHCADDNRCYKSGTDPDLSVEPTTEDMSEPTDLPPLPADGGGSTDMAKPIKHQGQACGAGDTCDTGYCVDGYCCESACAASCKACNVTGNLGFCTNVGSGSAPVGSRSCSAQPMSSCGRDGTCDGAGGCRDWPSGTQCAPGTCVVATGNFTNPSTCNGSGTCVANAGGNCAPYVCKDATQCFGTCTDGSQCSGTNSCTGGSCGTLSNCRGCTSGTQCTSGFCVDGYCCNSACNSTTASCQACDVPGSQGMCTTVAAGLPHGTRTCTNQGKPPCGGSCDGTSAACAYAGVSTVCGTTCTSSQLQQSFCDAAGACVSASPATCAGNFVCPSGGSACLTACGGNSDCYPSATFGCNVPSQQCRNYCVFDTDTFDDGCIYAP